MAQTIYGIDIGTYSIKIAEIERSLRSFDLVSFYEHPVVYNEVFSTEEAMASTLEKMVEDYGLAEGPVYVSLPGSYSSTRLIELPFGSAKKIDQTIEFEIESHVPFPVQDLALDYHIVESSKSASTCLVTYAKRSDVVKFLNIFSGAYLEPRFVGCEPVELGNVMKLGIIQPEGAYALLDIGHTKTNLAIFVGSKLMFARTIAIGGLHLTQAIAEQLQVPIAEAEKFKIEIGQVSGEAQDEITQKVSMALQSELGKLMVEIKQTFMNFQERHGDVVQAVYLSGGSSRLVGIDHYFSYELRKNVSFLDCLDFSFNKLADSDWCRPVIPMALALAFRGTHMASLPDLQYRRGDLSYRGDLAQLGGLGKQVAVLVGAIAFFVMASFGVNYVVLNSKLDKLSESVAKAAGEVLETTPERMLKNPDSVLSILNGQILEAQEESKAMKEKFELSYLHAMLEISRNLPPRDKLKLDIDEMNLAGDRLRLEGRTVSFEAVDTIKQGIAKSKLFQNVNTGNVKKADNNLVQFNLTLQIVPSGEADLQVLSESEHR